MKAKDAQPSPVPALIETLAEGEPLPVSGGALEESYEPALNPCEEAERKLRTAVAGLRSVEQWARRDNWDLRQRVIKTLKSIGEWNV